MKRSRSGQPASALRTEIKALPTPYHPGSTILKGKPSYWHQVFTCLAQSELSDTEHQWLRIVASKALKELEG